jgi:hypothetical protein
VNLDFRHVQQREDHWAIIDLKGKAGHTRTVPMPGWVKPLLDDWAQSANVNTGRLFRRVNKSGKSWGDGLTEKAVWHVVREYARKAGIERLAPHDSAGPVRGSVMLRVASSNRFSFSSGTSQFKRPSGTSAASSAFGPPSTTASASNPRAESFGAASGLPTSCPLDQSGLSECPLLAVALTASVSATDSVPQNDHSVAESMLVKQFQLQPHTIREEPFSGADDRRADEHLKFVNKTSL